MLSRKEKFARTDFAKIKKAKSQKIPTNIGVFCFFEALPTPKKGIVLSKKHFKTAVSRNKTKRLFYFIVKEENSFKEKTFLFYPTKNFTPDELLAELYSLKGKIK